MLRVFRISVTDGQSRKLDESICCESVQTTNNVLRNLRARVASTQPSTPIVRNIRRLAMLSVLVDRKLRIYNGVLLFGISAIIGFLLALFSSIANIDTIGIPCISPAKYCVGVPMKQVGFFQAYNWLLTFILLFPIFLWLVIDLLNHHHENAPNYIWFGTRPPRSTPTDMSVGDSHWESHIQKFSSLILLLAIASALTGALQWILSCFVPISNYVSHHKMPTHAILDWSTAAIFLPPSGFSQFAVLSFSFTAYVWMSIALFIYLTTLTICSSYPAYLREHLRNAHVKRNGTIKDHVRQRVLVSCRRWLKRYVLIIIIGLTVSFLMRLDAAYLRSPQPNLLSYWFSDANLISKFLGNSTILHAWLQAISPISKGVKFHVSYQHAGVRSFTQFTALAFAFYTLVCAGFAVWNVWCITEELDHYSPSTTQTGLKELLRGFHPLIIAIIGLLLSIVFVNIGVVLSAIVVISLAEIVRVWIMSWRQR